MATRIPLEILAYREEPDSKCFSIYAKTGGETRRVRLSINRLFQYAKQKMRQVDGFDDHARNDQKSTKSSCRQNQAGGDVWVECQFKTRTGKTVFYFRSIKTNRCVVWDAPSGAGVVICHTDLHLFPFLKSFAYQPLDRDGHDIEKISIEEPKLNLSNGFLSIVKFRMRKRRLRELEETERSRCFEPPTTL